MSSVPPRVAVVTVSILYGSFLILSLVVSFYRHFAPPSGIVLVAWTLMCIVLMPMVSTRLSDEGVSQITLRGRTLYPWTDVSSAKVLRAAVVLKVQGRTVRIPFVFFDDADYALRYVRAHLPHAALSSQHT
jgi:hypothetical protein